MKKILLALLAIALVGCHTRHKESGIEEDDIIVHSVLDSVFTSRTIQDTLNNIISAVDSFRSWTPFTVYDISIEKSTNPKSKQIDTIMCIWVNETTGRGPDSKIIGAIQDGHKVVGMSYIGFENMSEFVREDIFDKDLYMKHSLDSAYARYGIYDSFFYPISDYIKSWDAIAWRCS